MIQFISRSSQQYANLDEKLLYLILSNLLLNAIKYSPIQSKIQLILEDQFHDPSQINSDTNSVMDGIIFKVQDQGQGISPTDIPHLYTPFYRDKNVGLIAGTGLGLAVVKTCVDLHHGTIAVESNSIQGATFTFCIPTQHE